jgi:hypothetical protein
VRRGCKQLEGASLVLRGGRRRRARGAAAAERAGVGSREENVFVVEAVRADKDGRHSACGPCWNLWAWSK